MICLKKDFKHGVVSLKLSLADDVWYLSHIISPGDTIRMKSERKIKLGDNNSNTKVIRKIVVLTLSIISVDLTESMDQLRVKGTVLSGPEDVPHGSHHTFSIGLDDSFTLTKSSWPSYVRSKLDDAVKNTAQAVLLVLFDNGQALFSLLRQVGIEHLAELKGNGAKKQYSNTDGSDFYADIAAQITTYNKQYALTGVVAASPAFWKQYLEKKLADDVKKKVSFVETTVIARAQVSRLLARPELKSLLAHQRLQGEQSFIDALLAHLSKDEVAYGFDDVKNAASMGALKSLGLTESFLKKSRAEEFYPAVDEVLKSVDASDGHIVFIHDEQLAKTLNGLGGIGGSLRWKIQ